jgi:hypothetical protein
MEGARLVVLVGGNLSEALRILSIAEEKLVEARVSLDECNDREELAQLRLCSAWHSSASDSTTKPRRAPPKPPASTRNSEGMDFEGDPRWHRDDIE